MKKRTIEGRFLEIRKDNPRWNTLICFAEAVNKQNYPRGFIARKFMLLVDQEDFYWEDRKYIFKHLMEIATGKEEKEQKKRPKY